MHIGRPPTWPRQRLWSALAACSLIAAALLPGGCVGEIVSRDDDRGGASSQGAPDAGRRRDAGPTSSVREPVDRSCPDDLPRPLAAGLRVVEIAVYQTLKIPLYQEGEWITERAAPIIQGKRGIVRVFVETLGEYAPHPVQGVLKVKNGEEVTELVSERELTGTSTDADPESTFEFRVVGNLVREGTQFSVSLEEADCEAEGGEPADVRLPKSGTKALRAEGTGKLNITVVPMVVQGRLPVLTDDQRANIRAALLAFYPVAQVELASHAPINISEAVDATDHQALTEELLHRLREERRANQPPDNVYYLGVFQPAASFRAFCENGCVLGLAPQTTKVAPNEQYAVAAFFADSRGYETIVHELGHAHGRGHSPCDTGIVPKGIDPNYPRRDGSVGDWGWDNRTNALVPPTNKDIMGYCNPTWMSAYTYSELAERSRLVNLAMPQAQALIVGSPSAQRWRSVLLRSDGKARWGGQLETTQPAGTLAPASVLDATGKLIAEVQIARTPLSHTTGEFVSIPEPGADWDVIEWQGRRLSLGNILPPL